MNGFLFAVIILVVAVVSAHWGYSTLRKPIQQGKPIIIDDEVYIAIKQEVVPKQSPTP